ncbi:unnamed protein product [Linum trigynum]|uniref:RNase H type-1 domain-containing protein n=1 Tax=Linum trigynum TaxID=586398 RepID=A0AAV2FFC9_9ROSI
MKREYRWEKPRTGSFKVNVDATILKEDGTCFDLVVRDGAGVFRLAAVHRTRTSRMPEVAEAKAILWALNMSINHHYRPLLIELDCLSVIRKVMEENRTDMEIETVCREIRNALEEEEELGFVFWEGKEMKQPTCQGGMWLGGV